MAKAGRPIPWESEITDFILDEMRFNSRFIVDALDSGVKVYDTWNSGSLMDIYQVRAYREKVILDRER